MAREHTKTRYDDAKAPVNPKKPGNDADDNEQSSLCDVSHVFKAGQMRVQHICT